MLRALVGFSSLELLLVRVPRLLGYLEVASCMHTDGLEFGAWLDPGNEASIEVQRVV